METIIALLPVAYLAVMAIPLLMIDLKQGRLPNKIVLPLIAITFLSQLALAIFYGAWASLGISLGLGLVVIVLGVFINHFGYIGMGDVKLMSALTMLLASFTTLGAILLMPASIALGFIFAVIFLTKSKLVKFPLAPMIIATFVLFITLELVSR